MHARRRIHHNVVFCKMLVFPIYFATNLLIMVCLNRSLGKTGQNGSEKSLLLTSFLVTASSPVLLLEGADPPASAPSDLGR